MTEILVFAVTLQTGAIEKLKGRKTPKSSFLTVRETRL